MKNFSPCRGFPIEWETASFRRDTVYSPPENTKQQIMTDNSDKQPNIPGMPNDANISVRLYEAARRKRSGLLSRTERAACHEAIAGIEKSAVASTKDNSLKK